MVPVPGWPCWTVWDSLGDALRHSHRLPAVRAALLARLGRVNEARAAYDLALSRCGNQAEADHLTGRRRELA